MKKAALLYLIQVLWSCQRRLILSQKNKAIKKTHLLPLASAILK